MAARNTLSSKRFPGIGLRCATSPEFICLFIYTNQINIGEVYAMQRGNKVKRVIFLAAIVSLTMAELASAQNGVIEVKFDEPLVSESDISRTLQSLVRVQGIVGLYQDGVYLLTHYGDREDLFRKENQDAIDHPLINATWRYCSAFSTTAGNAALMGRNWDNQNVGSIIVSFYRPENGYASISFSRAIDLGYPLNLDLMQIASSELGNKLILAPFYAMDGINEHGLAVAITGVKGTTHQPKAGKELVFTPYLIRIILDQAKTIEEAAELVEKYIPFDLDQHSLNAHFMVADSTGRSVILEYDQDQWRKILPDTTWQILTTKPSYNVPEAKLKDQCWRYKGISETLEMTAGDIGWKAGMGILQDASQKGTTWSVVYALAAKELYFSVYQTWDTVYYLRPFPCSP